MSLFKKYRNLYWPKPSYLIIGKNLSEDKSASWIELFLDLSFVIAIALLSQLLVSTTETVSLIGFSFGFMLLFNVWRSSTFYNQSFYTNTLRNRMVVFGHILCALMLVVFTDTTGRFFSANFIDVAFLYMMTTVFVNIYLSYIWGSAWRHLYAITKQNDIYSMRALYWCFINGFTAFALFLIVVVQLLFFKEVQIFLMYTFGLVILFQLFSALFQQRVCYHFLKKEARHRGNQSVYTTDHVDAGHTIERFGLFILLIIGEMFLGIVTAIKQSGIMSLESFATFLVLLLIIAGFFWIYFDQVLSNTFKDNRIAQWTIMQFFIALNLLYLASFNREIIVDFHRYFYYIHGNYIVFFILLIIISFFIDPSEEGGRLEKSVDLSSRIKSIQMMRIITIFVLLLITFIPFPSGLSYALTILIVFLVHMFIGMKFYLESYDQKMTAQ